MKKINKKLKNNRIKIFIIIGGILVLTLLPIFKNNNSNKRVNMLSLVSNQLHKAHYSTEIESVDIESPDYQESEPGSWHIDKTAKWLDKDTAEVTFDVTSNRKISTRKKDIIFAFDNSSSMYGRK